MERLLADAAKISGIEYDISSYADIVEAIHVIQSEMGITGTTAKEASETISGSLAATKSAWQNLLTGLGDENADVGALTETFVDSAKTALDNLKPVILNALKGIGRLIDELAPVIAEELPELINSVLPPVISAGATIISKLAEALPELLPVLWEALESAINSLGEGLAEAFPDLAFIFYNLEDAIKAVVAVIAGTKIIGLIGSISKAISGIRTAISATEKPFSRVRGLLAANPLGTTIAAVSALVVLFVTLYKKSDKFREIVNKIGEVIKGVFGKAVEIVKNFIGDAVEFFTSFGEAVSDIFNRAVEIVKEFIGNCVDAVRSFGDAWNEGWEAIKQFAVDVFSAIGQFFSDALDGIKAVWNTVIEFFGGIWEGIKGIFNTVGETLGGFFSNAWENIKNAFAKVGEFFGGIWETIKGAFSTVGSTFGEFFSEAWENVKSAFSKVGEFFGGVWENIKEAFGKVGEFFLDVGKNIVGGIKDGIAEMWDGLVEWFEDKIDTLVDGVKDLLDIHSPSKVFAGIGSNMALGIGVGWDNEFDKVNRNIESGLDYGTASIDYKSSALGGAVNAAAMQGQGAAKTPVTIVVQLASGLEIARQIVDDINQLNRINGAPVI